MQQKLSVSSNEEATVGMVKRMVCFHYKLRINVRKSIITSPYSSVLNHISQSLAEPQAPLAIVLSHISRNTLYLFRVVQERRRLPAVGFKNTTSLTRNYTSKTHDTFCVRADRRLSWKRPGIVARTRSTKQFLSANFKHENIRSCDITNTQANWQITSER